MDPVERVIGLADMKVRRCGVAACLSAALVSSIAGCVAGGGGLLAPPPQFEGKADSGIAVTAKAYGDRGGAQLDVTIKNEGKAPITLNYFLDEFTATRDGATFGCKKSLESYPNAEVNPGASQTITLHCADLDSNTIQGVKVVIHRRAATIELRKARPGE
jgi:hypothetical protein